MANIYLNGKFVSMKESSYYTHPHLGSYICTPAFKKKLSNIVLRWLKSGKDGNLNISVEGGAPIIFSRAIIHIKVAENVWQEYRIATSEIWDEIISLRTDCFGTNDYNENYVTKNEILCDRYSLTEEFIPLGYKIKRERQLKLEQIDKKIGNI